MLLGRSLKFSSGSTQVKFKSHLHEDGFFDPLSDFELFVSQ